MKELGLVRIEFLRRKDKCLSYLIEEERKGNKNNNNNNKKNRVTEMQNAK